MKFVRTTQKQQWIARWLTVAIGVSLIGASAGVSPANAATWNGMLNFGGFHIGAFESSVGVRTYCLEPGASQPGSAQLTATRVTSLPAYSYSVNDLWGWVGNVETSAASGEVLRQMNWVLETHGVAADQGQAVAVQIALWELRRGPGNAAWIDAKISRIRDFGGQSHVEAGVALAQRARVEAVGPGNVAPENELVMSESEAHGSGTVSYPVGTTELTIEGGTFSDGSTVATIAGDQSGSLVWTANLHSTGWNRFQEVTVSGTWVLNETYWPAELVLHPPSREAEQRLGSSVAPVTGVNSGRFAVAAMVVDSQFEPLITTAVPQGIVQRMQATFRDTVTVTSAGESVPWPSRSGTGEFLPLLAEGTLYGPFTHPQVERADVPAGAPVAARSEILLDRGPGSYDAEAIAASTESGYYYWVWEIDERAQPDALRDAGLLVSGSRVADNFGVREESQLVPTELRWVTQLKHQALAPGERSLEDSIRVSLNGGAWLRDESGDRIPATIRFTVYQSDVRPTRQTEVPEGAREVGNALVEVSTPDIWLDVPPINISEAVTGWVTVRTCILLGDQNDEFRGYTSEWCDDYGIPEETAQLLAPEAPQALARTGGEDSVVPMAAGVGVVGIGLILVGLAGLQHRRRDSRIPR